MTTWSATPTQLVFRGYDPHAEDFARLKGLSHTWRKSAAGEHPAEYTTHAWHVIEDQGGTPSCGGHALSNALECAYYVASGGQVRQLSRWFAWLECQRADGGRLSPNRGVTINAAAEVAINVGVPEEALCPFRGDDWDVTIEPAAYENAALHKVRSRYWLDSYEAVMDFLWAGGGAVVAGVPWNFNRRAWHAVAITGWLRDGSVDGENSWGPDWDEDGHFQWSPDEVRRYLRTPGVAMVGLSDMTTPRQRDWNWRKDFLV
jgi:hypothetical protein